MITIIVGQRGVGKTSLLNRIKNYKSKNCFVYDLDQRIEEKSNLKINDIFAKSGEKFFRDLEKKYFLELIQEIKNNCNNKSFCFISVGGGFNLELLNSEHRVLWIQRLSDQWGRIFLDRPRLEPELHPIKEFQLRAQKRSQMFKEKFWDEYLIPEGLNQSCPTEEEILFNTIHNCKGILTILPSLFDDKNGNENGNANLNKWNYFVNKHKSWGLDFLEVRDDLIDHKYYPTIFKDLSNNGYSMIYSLRKGDIEFPVELIKNNYQINYLVDCDISLFNKYNQDKINIISCHDRAKDENLESVFNKLQRFQDLGFHIKLAVEIIDFKELYTCHLWQQEMPLKRSFLPRSSNGKWNWYRLMAKGKMMLQFFKEGYEGSALDQPSLSQWIKNDKFVTSFAAILGSPVQHSHTPIEQESFFAPWPVYAIDCCENEFETAMEVLSKLGLKAAAITSPLKLKAFNYCGENNSDIAKKYKSTNTICKKDESSVWFGHNTDIDGLKNLFAPLEKLSSPKIAVWGGGGTLPLLYDLLPKAIFYSAQTGLPRDTKNISIDFDPEILVWAAPNLVDKNNKLPIPNNWKLKMVIDLNYKEDSDGLWIAQTKGCSYYSGLSMFKAQAILQRDFFQSFCLPHT